MEPSPESISFSSSNAVSTINRLTSVAFHLNRKHVGSERRLKVVLTRNLSPDVMYLFDDVLDRVELVTWPEDRVCPRDWLLKNAPGASGLLIMPLTDKADKELLDIAGPDLRVVSTMSVGYEHIDVAEVAKRGIKIGYTPDVLTDAVADLSIMLALMAGRNVRETMSIVNEGKWATYPWSPFLFCGPQLSASSSSPTRTAGFLGFGRIAQATLARLVPFGITHCIYTTRTTSAADTARDKALTAKYGLSAIRRVALEELASASDVIFVLTPGGAGTHHLINESFLRGMKKTGVLVNTSRGTVLDSDALAKALREGWLWGAALDVVEGEPKVAIDHPLVKEPKCVILPHIGSATLETRVGMATLAVKNVLGGVLGSEMPAALDTSSYL